MSTTRSPSILTRIKCTKYQISIFCSRIYQPVDIISFLNDLYLWACFQVSSRFILLFSYAGARFPRTHTKKPIDFHTKTSCIIKTIAKIHQHFKIVEWVGYLWLFCNSLLYSYSVDLNRRVYFWKERSFKTSKIRVNIEEILTGYGDFARISTHLTHLKTNSTRWVSRFCPTQPGSGPKPVFRCWSWHILEFHNHTGCVKS